MPINMTYMIIAVIALYYCIRIYFDTKNRMILYGIAISLCSLGMKLRWLNSGDYLLDMTDFFWGIIDIARAILIIFISRYISIEKLTNKQKQK